MFGGSSKLGRGGGRGGGGAGGPPRGRSSYPPPSNRNPSAIGRMPSGGGGSSSGPRQRSNSGGKAAAVPPAVEETFSLVPSKSAPAFGMIIRLAPDLVEEIRRVEAQGGTAKIKFDAFSNNTSGNIINVGGKEFKFTWSRELGDLCDIYEEHQSGEDGDGVLIEAGCAWRKLNVQRTLDESTTNHMKMRSVEAEQRTKSRKAIVLDPGNPSLTKQLALAEANTWRVLNKQKKEPPHKKRKVDPPPVPIGGPKPAFRPGASTSAGKGRPSSSPGRSPPNQSDASPSPYGIGNFAKSHTAIEDVPPVLTKGNENSVLSENNTSTKATNALKDMSGNRANNANKPIDLQTLVINLLKDAPMSLKALEKAVGDKVPNAAKKVEPILKKIANFQAPGRYFLKSGAELESYKKLSPEQASSPEDQQLWPMAERNHDQLSVPGADNIGNISVCQPSGQCQLDGMPLHPEGQSSSPENVDIECLSPGIPGEEKASENREGQACSSSESASDSDSGSGSESGSSSDSDASNSKEGSDEDVDIMSDDDREPQHTIGSAVASTVPSQTGGCGFGHNEFAEKQEDDKFDVVDTEGQGSDAVDIEDHDSDAVDIEGDDSEAVDIEGDDSEAVDIDRLESDAVDIDRLESDAVDIEGNSSDEGHGSDGARNFYPDNNWKMEATADPTANEDGGNSVHEPFSSDHDKLRERQNFIGRLFDDTDNKDNFDSEQSDSSDRHARGKTKTGSELESFNQKSVRVKRLKDESINQFPTLGKDSQPSENMYNPSPKKYDEESIKASASQIKDPADRDYANCDSHRAPNAAFIEKSNSDYMPTSFKISKSTQIKPSEGSGRSNKHTNASGIVSKYAEGDGYPHEILSSRAGKASVDIQRDSNHPKDKFPRNKKDGESTSKRALLVDGSNRKHGELDGNEKDTKIVSGLSLGSSPLYNQRTSSPNFHVKGNGSMLQKVVTDLELGELRECEDTAVKQLERKSSFRQSDNKPSTSENRDMESDKRKRPRKSNSDSKKTAPPQAENVKGMSEQGVEDSARSHKSVMISRTQYHSEADTSEIGPQYSKLEGTNNKSRQNDSGARPGSSIEGYGETNRKTSSVTPQPQGSKRKSISRSSRESKRHPSGATANFVNGQKDTGAIPSDGVDWSKRETFFNEEDSTYLKHEKASPELKGPISDHSQYKAYIQEYQDKYGSYCSLNKILENYRNEFQRMGEDLEFAKSRDVERYNKILLQLKESYRKSGERHKRLKKIFVVLHEELKHLKQRMKDYAFSHGKD